MRVALVGAHPSVATDRSIPSRSHAANLAAALAERGVDVTVYSCEPGARDTGPVATDEGYRVQPIAVGGVSKQSGGSGEPMADADLAPVMGEFARRLTAALSDDRPDVVSADTWIYGIAAQLAADHLDVPTVQSFPELSTAAKRRQARDVGPAARTRFERLLARSASRVIASCSEDVLDLVKLGCPRAKISVLPQGVDHHRFSPVGDTVERRDQPRIVAMARDLLPHRGFDDLIAALPVLPNAEVVIVGGPLRSRLAEDRDAERLMSLAVGLGIESRVHFTGAVRSEHVPHVLRSADVFACPSWYEPFGLPVVEAMACGVPVVASNAGGMSDTVIDGVTGVLVPPHSRKQLAAALNDVLQAGALGSGMGAAGRTRVQSCYGWDRVAAEAQTIYERAIESRRNLVGQTTAANPS